MLSIEDVTVRFELRGKPPVTALDRVSLAVEDRQFSVIVGPSGCGKSTLLRLVAGLQVETEGRVTCSTAPSFAALRSTGAWCSRATRCSRG